MTKTWVENIFDLNMYFFSPWLLYIYIYDGVRQHNKLKNYHQVNCISQCIKNKLVPKGVELTYLNQQSETSTRNLLIIGTQAWKSFPIHSATKPLKKQTINLIKQIQYSKQSLKKQNTKKSRKLLYQMKPQQRKFNVSVSSRITTNLNTNPNLLLKRQI